MPTLSCSITRFFYPPPDRPVLHCSNHEAIVNLEMVVMLATPVGEFPHNEPAVYRIPQPRGTSAHSPIQQPME